MRNGAFTPYPIQWLGGLISTFLPHFVSRDPHRIVLTSFHGDGYRGNTRVLFERLCDHDILEPVWLSRNGNLVKDLQKRFGPDRAMYAHHPRGLHALASAGAVLFTHGTSDYPFLHLPRRAVRVQTYHGLPTKRGEYLRPKNENPPNWLHQVILNYRFQPINYFLSSSDKVTDIFSARFSISRSQFVETGYPAYDELIHSYPDPELISTIWPDAPKAEKLIVYAPTFRQFTKTKWFPFKDLDIPAIARFLDKHNALLAFRAHPNDRIDISEYQQVSPRFLSAGQEVVENVNQLISLSGAIITDYSSIYLEGLLKDIPALFIPYDRETYERGFPIPYDEVTPGPHISSQKDFLNDLGLALEGLDGYEKERERVRNLFYSSPDGNATDRVITFLEDKLINQKHLVNS